MPFPIYLHEYFIQVPLQLLDCISPALRFLIWRAIGSQTYATSTERIHSLRPHRVHAEGLLHFSVKVKPHIQHNGKLDDLGAGFEITEG